MIFSHIRGKLLGLSPFVASPSHFYCFLLNEVVMYGLVSRRAVVRRVCHRKNYATSNQRIPSSAPQSRIFAWEGDASALILVRWSLHPRIHLPLRTHIRSAPPFRLLAPHNPVLEYPLPPFSPTFPSTTSPCFTPRKSLNFSPPCPAPAFTAAAEEAVVLPRSEAEERACAVAADS